MSDADSSDADPLEHMLEHGIGMDNSDVSADDDSGNDNGHHNNDSSEESLFSDNGHHNNDSSEESLFSSEDMEEPLEDGGFKNEEDREAFRGITKHSYNQRIIPFLHDRISSAFIYDFHHQLSDSGKQRIGEAIANTTSLGQLDMTFTEEMPQSVELLFRGPFEQQNKYQLRRFWVQGDDSESFEFIKFTLNDWSCISQYLQTTRFLRNVYLCQLMLGPKEAEVLATALGVLTLTNLSLTGLDISDEDMALICKSLDASRLFALDVSSCSVGRLTCKSIADNILRDKETEHEIIVYALVKLKLENNEIDDGCVRDLCTVLEHNIHLKMLSLADCDDISLDGWKMVDELVYNTSSLEAVYRSNHNLEAVAGHPCPETLKLNRLGRRRYCRNRGQDKIVNFVTTDEKFNIEPFLGYNIKLMPWIIGLFATKLQSASWETTTTPRLWIIYEITRRWNPAELFGFPSVEKLRLTVAMDKLESRNCNLEADNATLLRENKLLKLEIERLKSGKQPADECTLDASKRARNN